MQSPITPENEPDRLESLRELSVLDTPSEERFDRITRLAKALFDVPIALVSLVDRDRQWFKSKQGLIACETSRDISFCGHAILSARTMWIEDATEDQVFFDNPLVTGPPFIRFYAGCPLRGVDGYRLGTLCVIDSRPRPFSQKEAGLLADLARITEQELSSAGLGATQVQFAKRSADDRRQLIDPATGVWNREGLLELLPLILEQCAENAQMATLIVGEVSEGATAETYEERELRLADVAQELRTYVRDEDMIGRSGDREFSILLPGCGPADAPDRVLALRSRVEESYALESSGITLGFDFVIADPSRGDTDVEAMLRAARSGFAPGPTELDGSAAA